MRLMTCPMCGSEEYVDRISDRVLCYDCGYNGHLAVWEGKKRPPNRTKQEGYFAVKCPYCHRRAHSLQDIREDRRVECPYCHHITEYGDWIVIARMYDKDIPPRRIRR